MKRIVFLLAAFLYLASSLPVSAEEKTDDPPAMPETGDSILLGSLAEPSNLIPQLSTDAASHEVSGLIFVAPLRYNKNFEIEPWAAESYQSLENGKRLRFTLRKDIRWSDGTALTADDVEFTYRLMIDPSTPTAYVEDYLAIKKFTKTGTYSFEVEYEKPFARALMTWMGAILPRHLLEGQDLRTTSFARHPIGAGPFMLKEWLPGNRLILQASNSYFEGRPYLNETVFRIIPDRSTMFLELKANRLDFMDLSPQQYLRQTDGGNWNRDWRKYRYLASMYTFMGYNLSHPFFKDVRVRQAISFAIDRDSLIKGALLGQGLAASGPYKPGTWPHNQNIKPIPYNPEKAAALLREAGWTKNSNGMLVRNGIPLSFTILTNQGNDQRIKAATIIQSQLKAIGIQVQIRTVEWAAFLKEFIDKGRFDAVIFGWTIVQDPDIFDVWHSSKAVPGGLNFVGYKSPEADALLSEARSITDQTKRKQLYDRLQEILHADQPYAFLYIPYSLPIVQKRFRGIEPAPAGIMHNFERWWVPRSEQHHTLHP